MSRKPAASSPLKILVDTNIWLDYYLARSAHHDGVTELFSRAYDEGKAVLYAASLSLKDVSYIVLSDLKAAARRTGRTIGPDFVAAAREVSWGCVRNMMELALIVPIGQPEALQALTYKQLHPNFEDDLILSAADRAGCDVLLTHNKQLAAHAHITCVDVDEALEMTR